MFPLRDCFVFKTYHNLQGSQTTGSSGIGTSLFKTYHNLQGSQTKGINDNGKFQFKTYHNLQGSQTVLHSLRSF